MSGLKRISNKTYNIQTQGPDKFSLSRTWMPGVGNITGADRRRLKNLKEEIDRLGVMYDMARTEHEKIMIKEEIREKAEIIAKLKQEYQDSIEERKRHYRYIKFALGKPDQEDIPALRELVDRDGGTNIADKDLGSRYTHLPGVPEEIMQVVDKYLHIVRALTTLHFLGPSDNEQLKYYYKYFVETELLQIHSEKRDQLDERIRQEHNRETNMMDIAEEIIRLYGEDDFEQLLQSINLSKRKHGGSDSDDDDDNDDSDKDDFLRIPDTPKKKLDNSGQPPPENLRNRLAEANRYHGSFKAGKQLNMSGVADQSRSRDVNASDSFLQGANVSGIYSPVQGNKSEDTNLDDTANPVTFEADPTSIKHASDFRDIRRQMQLLKRSDRQGMTKLLQRAQDELDYNHFGIIVEDAKVQYGLSDYDVALIEENYKEHNLIKQDNATKDKQKHQLPKDVMKASQQHYKEARKEISTTDKRDTGKMNRILELAKDTVLDLNEYVDLIYIAQKRFGFSDAQADVYLQRYNQYHAKQRKEREDRHKQQYAGDQGYGVGQMSATTPHAATASAQIVQAFPQDNDVPHIANDMKPVGKPVGHKLKKADFNPFDDSDEELGAYQGF